MRGGRRRFIARLTIALGVTKSNLSFYNLASLNLLTSLSELDRIRSSDYVLYYRTPQVQFLGAAPRCLLTGDGMGA